MQRFSKPFFTDANGDQAEEELWNALRKGDKTALGLIYHRYFARLYNYGMKFCRDQDLVKDCIQDLFLSLWKSRQTLSPTSSVKFYLFACLKRSITTQRSMFHRQVDNFEFVASREEELIMEQAGEQKKEQLLRMINKLSRRQKEVLFLRYFEGLSTREVAVLMSLNVNSVYVLLSKALDFLRKSRDKLVPAFIITSLADFF
ncbi:MAG TPA: sigma-70 family RNA polymerase sigma factor [Anseongella sp.]|nr:sigma-70 family RNA polymerase sigma factor [Anseongella sp.]